MKKFFIALLKGLGYFAIYYGIHNLVQGVWIGIKGTAISMGYVVAGLDLLDPAVMERYFEELMEETLKIAVPSSIIANILAVVVFSLIFICRKKKLTKEFSLRKLPSGTVLPLVLMGLGTNVLISVAMSLLPESALNSYQQSSSVLTAEVGIPELVFTVIIAPLVEELALRGLVYTRMKKGMPVVVAMILSSILFGVMHGQWVWMIFTALLGMVFVWAFERTKSLFAGILLHSGNNLCAMLCTFIPEDAPDWVGLIILVAAVVFTAVGLFLFLKTPKVAEDAEEAVAVVNIGEAEDTTEIQ